VRIFVDMRTNPNRLVRMSTHSFAGNNVCPSALHAAMAADAAALAACKFNGTQDFGYDLLELYTCRCGGTFARRGIGPVQHWEEPVVVAA